jgi:hypothetical protein
MLYQLSEGYFILEGGWEDKTVNVFVATNMPLTDVSLVVARDALPEGMSLADYVVRQRQTFQKKLSGFAMLRDAGGTIDGRPAHFMEFTWSDKGKPLHQMAMAVNDRGLLLNFTASIPGTADAETRKLILRTLRGFKFRTPAEPQAVAPAQAPQGQDLLLNT